MEKLAQTRKAAVQAQVRDALREGMSSGPPRTARTAEDIKTAGRARLLADKGA